MAVVLETLSSSALEEAGLEAGGAVAGAGQEHCYRLFLPSPGQYTKRLMMVVGSVGKKEEEEEEDRQHEAWVVVVGSWTFSFVSVSRRDCSEL